MFKALGPAFVSWTASFFGAGFMPLVPGTWGSAAGVIVFLAVVAAGMSPFAVCLAIGTAGFIVSGRSEAVFARKDPKYTVIDEVTGMMISLMWLPFYDRKVFFLAFILFRALDTVKIFPGRWIQDRHGSFGIMGDDIVAGIYANLILQVVLRAVS